MQAANGFYTHGYAPVVTAHHGKRTAEKFAGHVVKILKRGDEVLDVGCGPGSITSGFCKYVGPKGRIVGVDSSESVLEEARARPEVVSGAAVVDFRKGDGTALDFPSNSFDVVHAHQVLQHVTTPVEILKEMRRVARGPGGVVAVREVDFGTWTWYPEDPVLDEYLKVYRAVCVHNGGQPCAGRRLPAWFREAGFSPEFLSVSSDAVTYFGAEECASLAETWARRVLESGIATKAVAYGLASQEDLQRFADAWRRWGAAPDAHVFYIDTCVTGRVEGSSERGK
uniref:Methyltransferase domain-containing protein n=1 Tax=Chromera velia CCMP2878 TaxID=1169474 RepID=A0A0G4GHU3_9ALVE|mmetsp:Transcript_52908/g.103463  ORF Transcript_52908/g.103463 Transcript_52908/m.103463 type:complete len:283 (+) Transcript_52908:193-1041(+)|eukprot:Cvel_4726.t1-p1 / transcript=Cvel_4726.t1 / gene=Cvel_4726 / organism=Chromera_velia_CCMP2878 / gene_product=Uncharacterized methyltransferase C1B3.06c, putative / transcript_product=Uncharacterized methyltransferase C1B3.06c, putative / location=Cvel_scaffold210:37979-39038(+) / protein_length=282 / sequence_SO=supercontig / SO=protein_coding / is_pseudo=false